MTMSEVATSITSIQQAAQLAAAQAMAAYCNKTFSVGGLLAGPDGTVINQIPNRVIVDNVLNDPTAHGERQLIDWYYSQLAQGTSFPPASDITVVTSLDPCCMCTGAILTAGFRVMTVAEDDTSGINYGSVAKIVKLEHAWRRLDGRNDDGFQVAPFPG
jgi:tRNA(Arg) A34 adenosine deaminase TadA